MAQSLEKQVHEMVKLAKEVRNEAEFQQKHQYKKFKANYNGGIQKDLKYLVNGLFRLVYHEECIYWSHKYLEILRISDKEERYTVFAMLHCQYYCAKNHEKTIEYGQKTLDSGLQLKKSFGPKVDILDVMCESSNILGRYQDASKYAKELLKIQIVRYNRKEIATHDLLISYSNLLDHQIKEKNMIGAKKTIKNLKIFNLNSIDSNDVLVSMNKEGLKNLLPLSYQLKVNISEEEKTQHVLDFCTKNFSSKNDIKEFIINLQTYHYAGKICWMKFLIYRHFDSMPNCEKWGQIYRNMIPVFLMHLNFLVKAPGQNEIFEKLQKTSKVILPYKHYILELINCSLRLANNNPVNQHERKQIFSHLCQTLITSDFWTGSPRNYISEALRKYPINVMQELMPFIQFFIKYNTEELVTDSQNAKYQEQKEQMIVLKNSLIIMNHFKTTKET